MYVVTKDGKKLPVDDSSIDYDKDWVPFQQSVGLYTDDATFKPVWIVVGQKRDTFSPGRKNDKLEFVAERIYYHKPNQEELLWFMAANSLGRFDIVSVEEAFELDMNDPIDLGE